MIIRAIAATVLILGHASLPAMADGFGRFAGTFGFPEVPEESCATNPVFSTLSPDHKRITFAWETPVLSYTGQMISSYGGTIVAVGPDSLTMLRDNETRRDAKGDTVLWIMRATTDPEGYCWTRPDWPAENCDPVVRCGPQPNS